MVRAALGTSTDIVTYPSHVSASLLQAEIAYSTRHVRFVPLADIAAHHRHHVRFASGHSQARLEVPGRDIMVFTRGVTPTKHKTSKNEKGNEGGKKTSR